MSCEGKISASYSLAIVLMRLRALMDSTGSRWKPPMIIRSSVSKVYTASPQKIIGRRPSGSASSE